MFRNKITDDLELRLLENKDAEVMFSLTDKSRNTLRKWLPWVDSTREPKDTKNFIQFTLKQFADNNGFHAGIWYKGQLAGVIGYHAINWSNKSTSIGYWLGDDFTGKGIMTAATQAFVKHAFDELELNRVEIRCATENIKSRAIPQRLGFQEEGKVRQSEWLYDHFVDHVIYGMLKEDWTSKK